MNRIQNKDHRIGTYEINQISLSCFDDKMYIKNNGCDGLALGNYKKNNYLNNYSEKNFCQANSFNFQSNQDSFWLDILNWKNAKHLKYISEELMVIA